MLMLNVMGTFEGYEESKSQEGKFFAYIKPIATPPAAVLSPVKCKKKYGVPADGVPQLGNLAILCEPEQLPSVGVGEKVAATAVCWPISKPAWSERDNRVINSRDIVPLYVLEGEIKPTTAKAVAPAFHLKGYYQGALRMTNGQVRMHCVLDDVPPAWVLKQSNIKKGIRGYTTGTEVLGNISVIAESGHMPVVSINSPVEAKGVCWSVCEPYWNVKKDCVAWLKIPTPVFLTTAAITTEKVKASA